MLDNYLTETPFAHRGLHGPLTGHIENSLSAFQAANKIGHGFELDILLSKDNKAMVFHDVSLKRLTGKSGNIQDHTADQLSKITLTGSNDVILSLKEVLQNINPKYPILVEIKGDQQQWEAIAQAAFDHIKDYSGPIAIMSFYPAIVSWFQEYAPNILRGLVATSLNDGSMPAEFFSETTQISYIESLEVDFIAYDIRALPNDVTAFCQNNHIPVLTWTVRTDELRKKALAQTDNSIYENITL